MRGRVRRLTRDLPRFESVWLDALVQARVVTRFQATEINAGRGAGLQVGPFVLCQPVGRPGYGSTHRARDIITREEVRLTVVRVGSAAAQCDAVAAWKHTFAVRPILLPRSTSRESCRTIVAAWKGSAFGPRVLGSSGQLGRTMDGVSRQVSARGGVGNRTTDAHRLAGLGTLRFAAQRSRGEPIADR